MPLHKNELGGTQSRQSFGTRFGSRVTGQLLRHPNDGGGADLAREVTSGQNKTAVADAQSRVEAPQVPQQTVRKQMTTVLQQKVKGVFLGNDEGKMKIKVKSWVLKSDIIKTNCARRLFNVGQEKQGHLPPQSPTAEGNDKFIIKAVIERVM